VITLTAKDQSRRQPLTRLNQMPTLHWQLMELSYISMISFMVYLN